MGRGRRGTSLYITVLSTALIVSLLGLSGLTVLRIERKQSAVSNDRRTAKMNAASAVQWALRVIANDPNWRTTHSNGIETTPQSLGADSSGTLSWILEDSDGSLTDADTELRLKGIGRVGNTVQVSSVKIAGAPLILDTLLCSTYAVGNVTQSSTSTTNNGPFASAATFTVGSDVIGDVEGNPVVVVGSVSGTVTDPGPSRTMPSPSVWDTYLALATTIPYTNFPVDPVNPNVRKIDRELLSGNVNPFGFTDSEGIYYVQIPSGKKLTVSKARLHCTLLIELLGTATFNTTQSCLWDPFNGNDYPCAIVKGNGSGTFELKSSNASLKEGSQPKFNFNPSGDPYDGESDTDQNDQYSPKMRGLFHVIGSGVHSTLASNLELEGVFVTEGTMTLGANLTVTRNAALYDSPPLGYDQQTGEMSAVAGSWIWDAAP